MTEEQTTPQAVPQGPRRPLWQGLASRWLTSWGRLIVRAYALTMLLVILWAGYASVAYLVRSVFFPVRVPPQFTHWAATLDARSLRSKGGMGVNVPAPRAPIGHYHGVNAWYESDQHNNCTLSGCHTPLPHLLRKEVRAFANLHATFMACGMCHDKTTSDPSRVVWVGKTTGQPQAAPAILRLIGELEMGTDGLSTNPASKHSVIVALLREALSVLGEDPLLQYLLVQIETTDPGSPVWRQSVAQLKEELPNHLRGEYGAKLMTLEAVAQSRSEQRKVADLARRFQAAGSNKSEKEELHQVIHERVLARPEACIQCHGEKQTRLEYDRLGYSPARHAVLCGLPTARVTEQIRSGRPFYLPGVLEPGQTSPGVSTTRPG